MDMILKHVFYYKRGIIVKIIAKMSLINFAPSLLPNLNLLVLQSVA